LLIDNNCASGESIPMTRNAPAPTAKLMKASGMRRKVVRAGALAAELLQVVNSGASRSLESFQDTGVRRAR
jgi:hypothetical protein